MFCYGNCGCVSLFDMFTSNWHLYFTFIYFAWVGTLDGFLLDSEDESDKLAKATSHQIDQNDGIEEQTNEKTKVKAVFFWTLIVTNASFMYPQLKRSFLLCSLNFWNAGACTKERYDCRRTATATKKNKEENYSFEESQGKEMRHAMFVLCFLYPANAMAVLTWF